MLSKIATLALYIFHKQYCFSNVKAFSIFMIYLVVARHIFFLKHYAQCKTKALGTKGYYFLYFISTFSKSLKNLKESMGRYKC